MNKKQLHQYSHYLMAGAVLAVLLAAFGYLVTDLWLASTQWLMVGAVLALFGVYLRTEASK